MSSGLGHGSLVAGSGVRDDGVCGLAVPIHCMGQALSAVALILLEHIGHISLCSDQHLFFQFQQ